jgi:uncharacterized protein YjbJ (UPF0337 family)
LRVDLDEQGSHSWAGEGSLWETIGKAPGNTEAQIKGAAEKAEGKAQNVAVQAKAEHFGTRQK